MKVVGLFRELGPGIDLSLPSIRAAAGAMTQGEADAVACYLESGIAVLDVMEATIDPFDPKRTIAGGPSLVCDGEWVWRNDLAYFVRKYRVSLSDDFVELALKRGTASCDPGAVTAKWNEACEAYERAEKGNAADVR